jgi:predicted nuclease with TOPRIM domain
MPSVRDVEQLKKEVAELQEKLSETRGRIQQLKSEHWSLEEFPDTDALKEALIVLERNRIELEKKYNVRLSKYRKLYKSRFKRISEEAEA